VGFIIPNSRVDFRVVPHCFAPTSNSLQSAERVLVSFIVFTFSVSPILARLGARVKVVTARHFWYNARGISQQSTVNSEQKLFTVHCPLFTEVFDG
jgi:uncharacterized protein YcfL